ncbi:hypothetical protein [Paenibacillus sp. GCM10027626]|uniref:InlB B-repeat-containing protein n=1 Tax=Paenibacillus sp. GCM10027626 TaxID=3273411 RepID=UPI00363AFC0F
MSQTLVEAIDPNTSNVLAAKYVSNYENGVYVSFNVTGHMQFRMTRIYGENLSQAGPVYLSGVFLDGEGTVTETMPSPNIYQQPKLLTDSEIDYSVPVSGGAAPKPPIYDLIGTRVAINMKAVSRNNGILAYSWQKSSDGINWTNIAGASKVTYIFDSLTSQDIDYQYRCIVTDNRAGWGAGTAISGNFDLSGHNISIFNGISDKVSAKAGDQVSISADSVSGKQFVKWTADDDSVVFADASQSDTTFTMPDHDVVITANFTNMPAGNYKINVTFGKPSAYSAAPGDIVTITANAPPAGKQFAYWTSYDVSFANRTSATTTFVMPNKNVRIGASFSDPM